jgi:hypothetical protein
MEFILREYDTHTELGITRAEYQAIKHAKDSFFQVIQIEETFDALIEDYVELEETLLHFGIRHLAFSGGSHHDFHAVRHSVNRRLLHLLSTARLYRDSLLKRTKSLLDPEAFTKLKNELSDSEQQPMAFRIVEVLRNFTQHEEFPISGTSQNVKWEGNEIRRKNRASFSISIRINAVELSKKRDLPDSVQEALRKLGSETEIIGYIREYIEHMRTIHGIFRDFVKTREEQWKVTMLEGIGRFNKKPDPWLVIAAPKDVNNKNEEVQLFDEFFESLSILRKKNLSQANLSRRYLRWSGLPPD